MHRLFLCDRKCNKCYFKLLFDPVIHRNKTSQAYRMCRVIKYTCSTEYKVGNVEARKEKTSQI